MDVESEDRRQSIRANIQANLENSYCRYSLVQVSAAVEDDRGDIHYGVNVENAAFPSGICAEGSAISAMVTRVGARQIRRVFLTSSLSDTIWPCGACRQRISEFASSDCEVLSLSSEGEWESQAMTQLLPSQFVLKP
jgi:cytidine deaminase